MNATKPQPILDFENERQQTINSYTTDKPWRDLSLNWMHQAFTHRYMYNFDFLGRPIIQTPIDMIAAQELIWEVKPDLIIETGIAHGGSLIMSAAMLALVDYCEALDKKDVLDPAKPKRRVLGIDIDIRSHNRAAIESHPMANRIDMIQGSCLADDIMSQVREHAARAKKVLIFLDSNHTHEHVLRELELYAPFVTSGSYIVAFDSIVEDLPAEASAGRPWSPGNSPKTAVHAYLDILKTQGRKGLDGTPLKLAIDHPRIDKLMLTNAPDGYLKRI